MGTKQLLRSLPKLSAQARPSRWKRWTSTTPTAQRPAWRWILPVNQVAIIEGNAGKPIYQMSKWWARRRSSVFRSMLIAAATKAPEDTSHAAKLVWDNYYANHQKKGAFKHLKVADVFMGGGTTLVEGSRPACRWSATT